MEKRRIFSGAGCALITPFLDGEIDYPSLGALIEYQIEGGIDALIIGGTTAEAATLSDDERYKLYTFAKGKIAGFCERLKDGAKLFKEIMEAGLNLKK